MFSLIVILFYDFVGESFPVEGMLVKYQNKINKHNFMFSSTLIMMRKFIRGIYCRERLQYFLHPNRNYIKKIE